MEAKLRRLIDLHHVENLEYLASLSGLDQVLGEALVIPASRILGTVGGYRNVENERRDGQTDAEIAQLFASRAKQAHIAFDHCDQEVKLITYKGRRFKRREHRGRLSLWTFEHAAYQRGGQSDIANWSAWIGADGSYGFRYRLDIESFYGFPPGTAKPADIVDVYNDPTFSICGLQAMNAKLGSPVALPHPDLGRRPMNVETGRRAYSNGEWKPDPHGRHSYRYWDDGRWTDWVGNGGAQSVDEFDVG